MNSFQDKMTRVYTATLIQYPKQRLPEDSYITLRHSELYSESQQSYFRDFADPEMKYR
jgi:hypothetical protein